MVAEPLFDTLGFHWDRAAIPIRIPIYSIERVCFRFQRMLPEFVWDAGVLEGNPFTFAQVKTLLDGITVGGHKLSDEAQILNLSKSAKRVLALVKRSEFALNKAVFCELHGLVAHEEALEWGHFRGEGEETRWTPDVSLGEQGRYTPLPTQPGANGLIACFEHGIAALNTYVPAPFERAIAFFMFGALQQFFFDGNKRTSRLMMNGLLMAHGIDAISVPAAQVQTFNEAMVRFYVSRDASEMMTFLTDCHPELGSNPHPAVGGPAPLG
ncbi:MAG: cell filamentation protein Fic [Candidatus Competibacteraceae bacterium]|nr:cell filamentation protein Fic [Candidatus Competibacteraceae bacterium]